MATVKELLHAGSKEGNMERKKEDSGPCRNLDPQHARKVFEMMKEER